MNVGWVYSLNHLISPWNISWDLPWFVAKFQKLGRHERPWPGVDTSICTSTAYKGCKTPSIYYTDLRWIWVGPWRKPILCTVQIRTFWRAQPRSDARRVQVRLLSQTWCGALPHHRHIAGLLVLRGFYIRAWYLTDQTRHRWVRIMSYPLLTTLSGASFLE